MATPVSPLTALVLAAGRQGIADPVARLQHKSHKCLVEIDGIAMLERVVGVLLESGCFTRILVSVEDEAVVAELPALRQWLGENRVALVPSAANLADSLIQLSQSDRELLPLVVTTADNVLHTPELIKDFVARFQAGGADVSVAATAESDVLRDYAGAGFKFFRLADGGYSFCNLFGIRSSRGVDAVKIFRSGGQFRKRPWRILQVFGVLSLIMYQCRLRSLGGVFRHLGRRLGINLQPVLLPYSYGPIDVDNPKTFRLSEEILKRRRESCA